MSTLISDATTLGILNNTIIPMIQGENAVTLTDLTNLVDIGADLSTITSDKLKDITNTYIAKVFTTAFELAIVKKIDSPFFKTAHELGAMLQSVYATTVREAETSDKYKLVNGTEYNPNIYHGFDVDVKVYQQDVSFRLPYSIPNSLYISAFTPDGIRNLNAYIVQCVENDMNEKVNGLIQNVHLGIIANAKKVHLLTLFNASLELDEGEEGYTLADIKKDAELTRHFVAFCEETIASVESGMRFRSKKYNDGTVLSASYGNNLKRLMLRQFEVMVEKYAYANTYNKEDLTLPEHFTIDFWQGTGTNVVPTLADVSSVNFKIGNTTTNLNYVVCLVADEKAGGVSVVPEKNTSEYNGAGDFTNVWDYYTGRFMLDSRASAVAFLLD